VFASSVRRLCLNPHQSIRIFLPINKLSNNGKGGKSTNSTSIS
jgi:hypothetical protein